MVRRISPPILSRSFDEEKKTEHGRPERQLVVLSDIWYIDDLRRFEDFKRAVEMTPVAPSAGVSGRALARRVTEYAPDIQAALPLPLAYAADQAGLVSAIAVPVIGIDAPVAV